MITVFDGLMMIICVTILSFFYANAVKRGKEPVSSIMLPDGYVYYANGHRLCMAKMRRKIFYRAYLIDEEDAKCIPVSRDFLNRPFIKTNARTAYQAEEYVDYYLR